MYHNTDPAVDQIANPFTSPSPFSSGSSIFICVPGMHFPTDPSFQFQMVFKVEGPVFSLIPYSSKMGRLNFIKYSITSRWTGAAPTWRSLVLWRPSLSTDMQESGFMGAKSLPDLAQDQGISDGPSPWHCTSNKNIRPQCGIP